MERGILAGAKTICQSSGSLDLISGKRRRRRRVRGERSGRIETRVASDARGVEGILYFSFFEMVGAFFVVGEVPEGFDELFFLIVTEQACRLRWCRPSMT